MAGELKLKYTSVGETIYAIIFGQNRTTRWNGTAFVATSAISDANWLTGAITLAELVTSDSTPIGTYVGTFPTGVTDAGEYTVEFYANSDATPGSIAIGTQDIWWEGTEMAIIDASISSCAVAGDEMTLASSEDVYHADIFLTRDTSNSQDEYTVQWYKNGNPILSGLTDVTIQVVKRSDGSDLIAVASMTQIGSTGAYKYDSSTLLTSGEAAIAVVSATIDAATRTWRRPVGRDV